MADKKADVSQLNQSLSPDMIAQSFMGLSVRAFMSSPVRTIQADASLVNAQSRFLRYGHTCLCVVDQSERLVGMLSRRDLDVALRHSLQSAQVITCMSTPVRAITPQTSLAEAHWLMVTYDIGRLPVLFANRLTGIITRSDLLRQLRPIHSLLQPAQTSAISVIAQQPPTQQPPVHPEQLWSTHPVPDQLFEQFQIRSRSLWSTLQLLISTAEDKGWTLYVVGGAVRDLLLSHIEETSRPLVDIDLVVDGAQAGAGAILAASAQASYPDFELKVYGEFQTAALTGRRLQDGATSLDKAFTAEVGADIENVEIDIATARTEFYPYPAANPEVEASTIHQDLYRRDFTINAMALCLNGVNRGQLLDFFGGWLDLQQRQIRVIHPNSFIEDPTRIFRALRFATRLGFELDPYTQRLVSYAVNSPLYARVKAHYPKVPALQSRLTAELKKILSEPQWPAALEKLSQLGALTCLHPRLSMTSSLRLRLCRVARWQRQFLSDYPRWHLLLVVLIAELLPEERVQVANTLNLDPQSRSQLENLSLWECELTDQLSNATQPSELYQALKSYSLVEQLLIVARNPYTLGPQIWQHIIHLSRMSPLINGGTLKRLGYPPGPQYREILTAVHHLTLDGILNSAKSAESYVLAHYPLIDSLNAN